MASQSALAHNDFAKIADPLLANGTNSMQVTVSFNNVVEFHSDASIGVQVSVVVIRAARGTFRCVCVCVCELA